MCGCKTDRQAIVMVQGSTEESGMSIICEHFYFILFPQNNYEIFKNVVPQSVCAEVRVIGKTKAETY